MYVLPKNLQGPARIWLNIDGRFVDRDVTRMIAERYDGGIAGFVIDRKLGLHVRGKS